MERHARALVILVAGSVFTGISLVVTAALIRLTAPPDLADWALFAGLGVGVAIGAATAGVLCEPRLDRWVAFTTTLLTARSRHEPR